MSSVVKPVSDAGEPMCAQDASDDEVDGTENLNHGLAAKPRDRRCRLVISSLFVLAIVGAAIWWKLSPARRSTSLPEDVGENTIAKWLKLPSWSHVHKDAPVRQAQDRSDSVGIKALASKANALTHEAEAETTAASSIKEIAAHDQELAKILEHYGDARKKVADALGAKAALMKAAAEDNITSAKVMNHTASLEASTARMIISQAVSSIQNAEKMKKGSNGVQVIDDLVKKQEDVAEASKTQANSQMEAAKAMMSKSAALIEQAQKDLASANAVRKMGTAETQMAKDVSEEVKLAVWHAKNATAMAQKMQASATKHQGSAKLAMAAENASYHTYMDADAAIAHAKAEIEQATRQGAVADQDVKKAAANNQSAHAYHAAAEKALKALDAQKDLIQTMESESKGMKNSKAIEDLAAQELNSEEDGVKQAREDISFSEALAEKAAQMNSRAEREQAESNAIKQSAQKRQGAATKVKAGIDAKAEDVGIEEIMSMKGAAEQTAAASKAMQKAEKNTMAFVATEEKQADEEIAGANALKAEASKATPASGLAIQDAAQTVTATAEALKKGVAAVQAADSGRMEMQAGHEMAAAVAREDQMLKETAARRICMHLPGVQLTAAGQESDFHRIVGSEPTGTHAECAAKCKNHAGCKQAVFSYAAGCHLYTEASEAVANFLDEYNSTYCSDATGKETILDMIHKAYAQKPYLPEPVECSWAGEDCSQTKCCNNYKCKWDFSECGGYTCYKRDAGFAGCNYGDAPAGWDGYKLGGPRPLREIPKAKTPWLLQGTSLFCFSAVMWNKPATKAFYDSEAELANNWKNKGLGIMQCDESMILAGEDAPAASWGSISNIDAFIHTWEKVRQDGRYKNHDWVVKVDTDAVFFPDRMKMHLDQLRTPRGAKVYLKNVDYRFQFMGALEVLTKEALEVYYLNADLCSRKQGHEGGEDFYLKTCLDGIGVDHQTDYKLLHDKYAAQNGCSDGWAAAFHFYKAVDKWNACHNEASQAR